jgi:hypothetical protein
MAARCAENNIAAQCDREATELMSQLAKLEKRADGARSPETRQKCRAKAQQLRKAAIDALERAKLAAAKQL